MVPGGCAGAITSSSGFIHCVASPGIGLLGGSVVHAALPWKKVTLIPDGNISMGSAVVLLLHFARMLLCQLAFVSLSATDLKSCGDLAQYS